MLARRLVGVGSGLEVLSFCALETGRGFWRSEDDVNCGRLSSRT